MKMMFLFDKELRKAFERDMGCDITDFPVFEPWLYGPFSRTVFEDIEFLVNNGLVEVCLSGVENPTEEAAEFENWMQEFLFEGEAGEVAEYRYEESFSLTDIGVKKIESKCKQLTENQKSILSKFKSDMVRASLGSILRYTYVKYPEYASKSVVKDKLFG
jgi:uncharacterized protein YwgA